MSYLDNDFSGYIVRLQDNNISTIECLINENFTENWKIELLSESLFLYYTYPSENKKLSYKNIWNFYHKLSSLENVLYVENNFITSDQDNPKYDILKSDLCNPLNGNTDKKYKWHHENIKLKKAQDYAKSKNKSSDGDNIIIAITDTGYTKHRAIDNENLLIKKGWNYLEGNNDAFDYPATTKSNNPGHGTSVTSLIIGNDKEKCFGVALNAKVIPIRMTNTVMFADRVKWIRSIDYAIYRKALITSTSLRIDFGGSLFAPIVEEYKSILDMLNIAIKNGIVCFAAGGQYNGFKFGILPAAAKYAISCTGNNIDNKNWFHSFKAYYHDIAAPAQEVYVADTSKYDNMNVDRYCGTSFSTAIMAGVCATWYSFWTPEWLHTEYGKENIFYLFRYLVQKYGINKDVANWDTKDYGPGIVDVERLLKMDGDEMPTRIEIEKYKNYFNSVQQLDKYNKFNDLFPENLKNEIQNSFQVLFNNTTNDVLIELKFHLQCNQNLLSLLTNYLIINDSVLKEKIKMELEAFASEKLINSLND